MHSRILYVHHLNVSFILRDIAMLEKSFRVDRYFTDVSDGLKLVKSLIKQILTMPWRLWSADLVVVFFAGYHSVLPVCLARVFGKPCLVMLGGSDCYNFPSIDYGNYRKVFMRLATTFSIRYATHLSPVHEALIESDYHYDDGDYKRQGYNVFIRNLKTPATTIYLEYDPDQFRFRDEAPPPKTFLTIGYGMDGNTFRRKGVDLIVAAARDLPGCVFTVVGSKNPERFADAPDNVVFLPPVPYEELSLLYHRHQFYLQLSMAEGFPSAICEAMLCGCIPIGSEVAAIPYIIGDTGFVLHKKRVSDLISLCLQAMSADTAGLSVKARSRIEAICPPGSRSIKLISLVSDLINSKGR